MRQPDKLPVVVRMPGLLRRNRARLARTAHIQYLVERAVVATDIRAAAAEAGDAGIVML